MSDLRTYTDLNKLIGFIDRFNYLKLDGRVGVETFGFDRYLNQQFYHSIEWKKVRDQIIIRDNGCDMGLEGHEIFGVIYVHHMNPILLSDIVNAEDILMNPEYLISVSRDTHNAIHYGDIKMIEESIVERKPNDTCPWKKNN